MAPPKFPMKPIAKAGPTMADMVTKTDYVKFTKGTMDALSMHDRMLADQQEVLDALVEVVGLDQVVAAMNSKRVMQLQQTDEENRQKVAQKAEEGKLVEETVVRGCLEDDKGNPMVNEKTVVEPGSNVSLIEVNPEGNEIPGSFICVPLAALKSKDQRDALKGQTVGFEMPSTPVMGQDGKPVQGVDGNLVTNKVVLTGIYRVVPDADLAKAKAEAEAVAAPAPEALAPTNEGMVEMTEGQASDADAGAPEATPTAQAQA